MSILALIVITYTIHSITLDIIFLIKQWMNLYFKYLTGQFQDYLSVLQNLNPGQKLDVQE